LARNDSQLMHSGETIDKTFSDPLAEIFEVGVTTRIFERQDGERINRLRKRYLGGGDEAVAATRYGFDEARCSRGVVQYGANLADANIQALLEVDERVLIPKFMLNFLSGDELARAADKKRKELEWLWLKMQRYLALKQVACARVQFERAKSDGAVRG